MERPERIPERSAPADAQPSTALRGHPSVGSLDYADLLARVLPETAGAARGRPDAHRARALPGPTPRPDPAWAAADVQRDKRSVLGHLAGSMAHELSAPLDGIGVTAARLLRRFRARVGTSEADPGTVADLERLAAEAHRAGAAVEGLLEFARQREVSTQPVSLADVVAGAVRMARHHFETRGLRLAVDDRRVRDAPGLDVVRTDPHQMRQVLLSLILNAEQAIAAAGVGTFVLIRLTRPETDMVVVEVEDDGPGVPKALKERIFEPFFTTREASAGAGVGLALAASWIRRDGGGIAVEDSPAGGARFVIVMPAAGPTAGA